MTRNQLRLFIFCLGLCYSLVWPTLTQAVDLAAAHGYQIEDLKGELAKTLEPAAIALQRDWVEWAGTPEGIAKQMASYLKNSKQSALHHGFPPLLDKDKGSRSLAASDQETQQWIKLVKSYLPRRWEEIEALAQDLRLPPRDLASHFARLKPQARGVIYASRRAQGVTVGLNREGHPAMHTAITSRIKPSSGHATLGHSAYMLGLYDGVNDQGVFIAYISPGTKNATLMLPLAIRTLLEQNTSVFQARKSLSLLPNMGDYILLMADPTGAMALLESHGGKRVWREATVEVPYLIATEHYRSNQFNKQNKTLVPFIIEDYHKVERAILSKKAIDDSLFTLLTTAKGLKKNHFQYFFRGQLYAFTLNLQTKNLKYQIGSKQFALQAFNDSLTTLNQSQAEFKLPNEFPNLIHFADLDWWRSEEPGRDKVHSLFGVSVKSLGMMLTNRYAWRLPLGDPIFSPYLDLGTQQQITPVFVRHGTYIRFSSKSWLDLEVGRERHNAFLGIDAMQRSDAGYNKIDLSQRLKDNDTRYFDANLTRFTAQFHQTLGPLVIQNYLDYYRWEPSNQIDHFLNLETGLSQKFAGEYRNNLLLILPLGAPVWSLSSFYQKNWLAKEEGFSRSRGFQLNFISMRKGADLYLRLPWSDHSATQPNADDGLDIQVALRWEWL